MSLLLRRRPAISFRILSEYTFLEYIETDGTGQYIVLPDITHSAPKQGEELQVTIDGYLKDLSNLPYLYGAADGVNYNQYIYLRKEASRWSANSAGTLYWNNRPIVGERFKIIANTLDGIRVYDESGNLVDQSGVGLQAWSVSTNRPMHLLASNKATPSNFANMKLYHAKFEHLNRENGTSTILADLYPCIKVSSGEVGLYDKENDVFYANAGTGEFIAGPKL